MTIVPHLLRGPRWKAEKKVFFSDKAESFFLQRQTSSTMQHEAPGSPQRSTRASSGYKYVYRQNTRLWCLRHPYHRKRGFQDPRDAAVHLQQVLFQGTSSQASAAPEVVAPEPAAPEPAAPEVVAPEVVAPGRRRRGGRARGGRPEPAAQRSRAAWMTERTSVQYREAADLFGRRIRVRRSGELRLAVIKSWLPYNTSPFGVVFDDTPEKTMMIDLKRLGARNWELLEWEGDIWDTMDLRPLCPSCAHPMGTGREAWTVCSTAAVASLGAARISSPPGRRARTSTGVAPFTTLKTKRSSASRCDACLSASRCESRRYEGTM